MPRRSGNALLFWAVVVSLLVTDVITKAIAVAELSPRGTIVKQVIGEFVQFRLVYNPGAAFGLYLGQFSRWIFMALTLGALFVLWSLFRTTRDGDTPRVLALALVCAGAVGNLIDRVRSSLGVVDFIDVGVGDWRWPTFNVADMAVSVGAFLLAWVLWGEDAAEHADKAENAAEPAPAPGAAGGKRR